MRYTRDESKVCAPAFVDPLHAADCVVVRVLGRHWRERAGHARRVRSRMLLQDAVTILFSMLLTCQCSEIVLLQLLLAEVGGSI